MMAMGDGYSDTGIVDRILRVQWMEGWEDDYVLFKFKGPNAIKVSLAKKLPNILILTYKES